MLEPIKAGLGGYMGRFYAGLMPTTKPMQEFVSRSLAKSVVWAPARMVDAAEEMLSLWMRTDHDETRATKPAPLPAIVVAMARDYIPTGRDFTRQVAERVMVQIPSDPKQRMFGLRTVAGDIRVQVAIFAHEPATAQSIAAQFLLHTDSIDGRRFKARYRFAGQDMDWPVQIEAPDVPAMSIATEAKNITALAIDLTLKASIPLFDAPKAGEANDGQGVPGTDDPAGYPMVEVIDIDSHLGLRSDAETLLREYTITEAGITSP